MSLSENFEFKFDYLNLNDIQKQNILSNVVFNSFDKMLIKGLEIQKDVIVLSISPSKEYIKEKIMSNKEFLVCYTHMFVMYKNKIVFSKDNDWHIEIPVLFEQLTGISREIMYTLDEIISNTEFDIYREHIQYIEKEFENNYKKIRKRIYQNYNSVDNSYETYKENNIEKIKNILINDIGIFE